MLVKKLLLIGAANLLSVTAFADVYNCAAGEGNLGAPNSEPTAHFSIDTAKDGLDSIVTVSVKKLGEGYFVMAACYVGEGKEVDPSLTKKLLGCTLGTNAPVAGINGTSQAATEVGSPILMLSGDVKDSPYSLICKKQ